MANIFRELWRLHGVLNTNKRFCRDSTQLDLIQNKLIFIEEVKDFAKQYAAAVHHQSSSNVGDRLYYYLTEGNLSYRKVADHFNVPYRTVATNIHYASKAFAKLVGDLLKNQTEAEDLETVHGALSDLRNIKKSVMNPYDLSEISLKKVQKRKVGSLPFVKSSPYIVIPRR